MHDNRCNRKLKQNVTKLKKTNSFEKNERTNAVRNKNTKSNQNGAR